MADRVHFTLPYTGRKPYRLSSELRGDHLLHAVRSLVARHVEHWSGDLYWNDGDSNVVLKTAEDVSTAIDFAMKTRKSTTESPCIHLHYTTSEPEDVAAAKAGFELPYSLEMSQAEALILKIKQHIRDLVNVAHTEHWTDPLRAAMQPLFCPDSEQLQLPSAICAAEIAVQLRKLEEKLPIELQLLLQDARDLSHGQQCELKSDWLEKEMMAKTTADSTDPTEQVTDLIIASKAVMLAVELSMHTEFIEFEADEIDDQWDGTNKEEHLNLDEWIDNRAAAIRKKVMARRLFARKIAPCPEELILQQQTHAAKDRSDREASGEALADAEPLDRVARITEHLEQPFNPVERKQIPFNYSLQSYGLLGYDRCVYRARGEEPPKGPLSIESMIAPVLRRTVEDLPAELVQQLQVLRPTELSRMVLLDWMDRLAEEKRLANCEQIEHLFGNDEAREKSNLASPHTLLALLKFGVLAEKFPEELMKLIDLTLERRDGILTKSGDARAKEECDAAKIEERNQMLIRADIEKALNKYMCAGKSGAFVKYMLPRPVQPEAAELEVQSTEAEATDKGWSDKCALM